MKIAVLFAVLSLSCGFCLADDSDATLRRWLSVSDFVVAGTIVTEPIGILTEAGVPNYNCRFTVSDVCKGDASLKGRSIKVSIMRFEMDERDQHPLIKKDAVCILFLKKDGEGNASEWTTSDFWFGIQHPSPWMVKSLRRLDRENTAQRGRAFLLDCRTSLT